MLKRRTFLIGAASLSLSGCVVLPQGQSIPTISMPQFMPPSWMAEDGKTHYQKRVAEISAKPPITGGVLLIGDSITEGWMNHDFPYNGPIANHGIGWDTSAGLLARKELAFREKPDVVFVMIGTNDLGYDIGNDVIIRNLRAFFTEAQNKWPQAKLYLQSILPRNDNYSEQILDLNHRFIDLVGVLCSRFDNHPRTDTQYLDWSEKFSSAPGVLNPALTTDGLHLNTEGYRMWGEALKPYLPK